MLDVANIFLILLFVDVVCGPLLTLVLASPEKSHRAHAVDFTLIGTVQMLALLYGLLYVLQARPETVKSQAEGKAEQRFHLKGDRS